MTEPSPIYDQVAAHHHARPGPLSHLKDEAEHLLQRAEHPFRHDSDLPSQTATQPDQQPQEAAMTTPAPADAAPRGIAAELESKIEEVATNISGWFDDLKAHAAPVVDKAVRFEQQIEGDKFIGGYLAANFSVPEHLVSLGLDFLAKLVSASASPQETPAETDTQPAPASA